MKASNQIRIKSSFGALFTGMMLMWGAAAEDSNTDRKLSSEVTIEQRNQMAQAHEKMAECLRSSKLLNQCRSEMRTNCKEVMGKDGCPMMGKGDSLEKLDESIPIVEAPKNLILMSSARATALKEFPGTVKSSELEYEKGRWIYSFDIVGNNKVTTEISVDAKNGKIVGHEVESEEEEVKET